MCLRKRNIFITSPNIIAFCFILLTASINISIAATYSAYVMGYFKESPDSSSNSYHLHLAVSTDGLTWVPLNHNTGVLKPAMGTRSMRDPFFYRMPDGTFTIVATDNWNSEYIYIWSSPDLRSFSNERLFRVNTTGMHAWAPEIFYDVTRSQYAIIWSGNTDRNRIYVNYTKDFTSVSTPKVFFDPGFSVIDAHMEVDIDGYNYLYYKGEVDYKLYGARSKSLNTGSFDVNTYTIGYGAPVDKSHTVGPILVRNINTSSKWWLWGESPFPANAVFYVWQTDDLSTDSWKKVDMRNYTVPPGASHATIVPISETEYQDLIVEWGTSTWDIIKSYKFPACFLRHKNLIGRISAFPLDIIGDMQWQIVAGLADSGGVSLKSINMPGYYLRHKNFSLILERHDTTASFNADATFFSEKGFADSEWVSFRSYNFPDRYIRISEDSTLSIEVVTDSSILTEKENATFMPVYKNVKPSVTNVRMNKFQENKIRHIKKAGILYLTHTSINLKYQQEHIGDFVTINLYKISGRLVTKVYEGRLVSNQMILPLSKMKLSPGIYVVDFITTDHNIRMNGKINIKR